MILSNLYQMMWVLLTKPMQKSVITVCLHCSFARLKNKHMGVLGTNVATMSWLHWSPVLGMKWFMRWWRIFTHAGHALNAPFCAHWTCHLQNCVQNFNDHKLWIYDNEHSTAHYVTSWHSEKALPVSRSIHWRSCLDEQKLCCST